MSDRVRWLLFGVALVVLIAGLVVTYAFTKPPELKPVPVATASRA